MGNCCGGNANEGEVSIAKGGYKTQKGFNQLLDDREIGGLKGTDKIRLIVKI